MGWFNNTSKVGPNLDIDTESRHNITSRTHMSNHNTKTLTWHDKWRHVMSYMNFHKKKIWGLLLDTRPLRFVTNPRRCSELSCAFNVFLIVFIGFAPGDTSNTFLKKAQSRAHRYSGTHQERSQGKHVLRLATFQARSRGKHKASTTREKTIVASLLLLVF